MKDMTELYEKLKKNYKPLEISIKTVTIPKGLNDSSYEYEMITIIKEENKIIVYEDMIQIYKQNKFIMEQEGETLERIYELVLRQIRNWYTGAEIKPDKDNKDNILLALMISIFTTILMIISSIFSSFDNVMMWFANILIAFLIFVLLFTIFYYLFKRIFIKIKLNKVSQEDLITIENYYKINKDNYLLSEYNLYFLFDDIDYICSSFYKMKKKIPNLKDIYCEEELNIINNSDNKEIIELYNKSKSAINSIYKYYDETGKRKI